MYIYRIDLGHKGLPGYLLWAPRYILYSYMEQDGLEGFGGCIQGSCGISVSVCILDSAVNRSRGRWSLVVGLNLRCYFFPTAVTSEGLWFGC